MDDNVCWSAQVDALSDWRYEGIICRKEQGPCYQPGNCLYVPDVVRGPDERYYLYYTLDFTGTMSVAVQMIPPVVLRITHGFETEGAMGFRSFSLCKANL